MTIRGCSYIADEEGRGGKPIAAHCRKFLNKRSLRVLKMWVERTIDLNLTIYVKKAI